MSCQGNCGSCNGCSRELELTKPELELLEELAQIPFLPVARKMEDPAPIFPGREETQMALILQCLEKKGLISLDYEKPLIGFQEESYLAYPIRGSFALTQRGQQVLQLLEYQGIRY